MVRMWGKTRVTCTMPQYGVSMLRTEGLVYVQHAAGKGAGGKLC